MKKSLFRRHSISLSSPSPFSQVTYFPKSDLIVSQIDNNQVTRIIQRDLQKAKIRANHSASAQQKLNSLRPGNSDKSMTSFCTMTRKAAFSTANNSFETQQVSLIIISQKEKVFSYNVFFLRVAIYLASLIYLNQEARYCF